MQHLGNSFNLCLEKTRQNNNFDCMITNSHCAGVATVHPDAGQPVYRDAPGHIL